MKKRDEMVMDFARSLLSIVHDDQKSAEVRIKVLAYLLKRALASLDL